MLNTNPQMKIFFIQRPLQFHNERIGKILFAIGTKSRYPFNAD